MAFSQSVIWLLAGALVLGAYLQREEKAALILLLMVASSLAVAFWSFCPPEGEIETLSSLTVEGRITQLSETSSGGHLLIRLDTRPEQIFVPADRGAEKLSRILAPGDRISVTGRLDEFKGQPQIRVTLASAVKKL